jgi:hypothetical protein
MVRKLVQYEGKLALPLDDQILKGLQIGPNTPVDVVVRGREIVITVAGDPVSKQELDHVLEGVNHDFGKALKRLAE